MNFMLQIKFSTFITFLIGVLKKQADPCIVTLRGVRTSSKCCCADTFADYLNAKYEITESYIAGCTQGTKVLL